MIPPIVAKVHFAVLDDWVIPISDVDGPIGSHFDIDGPEGAVGGTEEVVDPGGGVGTAVGGKAVGIDAMAPEVWSNEDAAHVFGNVRAGEDFEAAEFGLTGIESLHDALGTWRGDEDGAGEDVVDAVTARAVGGEGLAVVVEDESPGIDEAFRKNLGLLGLRAEMPNASAHEAPDAVRGFEVAVDVNGLEEVEHAIRALLESVNNVVGVLGSNIIDPSALLSIAGKTA